MSFDTGRYECYGHTRIYRVFSADHRECILDDTNQITTQFLTNIMRLLLQRGTDQPAVELQLFSVWFESSAVALAAPSITDVGPDAASVVVAQKTIPDSDRIDSADGSDQVVAEISATLTKLEAVGSSIAGFSLFNKGSLAAPPAPGGWVPGTDGVYCIARQVIAPFMKTADFALEVKWAMVLKAVTS